MNLPTYVFTRPTSVVTGKAFTAARSTLPRTRLGSSPAATGPKS